MKVPKLSFLVMSLVVIATVLLASCAPAATPPPEPTMAPEPTKPPEPTAVPPTKVPEPTATPEPAIGSPEHPIKVLFVPSVDAQVIVSGGQIMADALNKATGLTFEVSVPTSYAATIEEMCASPTDTMGFIPALGYALASQLCGVDVAFKAVRYGWSVYWAEFLVQRDSNIMTLADLNGKKWGYTDPGSTSGYMVPLAMFKDMNITPGESVETGGHPQAVKAVYNGEVDFGTAFYSPYLAPEGAPAWKPGDDPEIPADLIDSCAVTEDGKKIMCGGYREMDARPNIRTEAPDVIQKVRILDISPEIPNDTLSFSPDFPADVRAMIETALIDFSKTEDWANSIGSADFYAWSGIDTAVDSEYDMVRSMVEVTGLTLEGLGQ
jgi:phosphonate transport system substrate-binding protein